jgi:hypothetical protein
MHAACQSFGRTKVEQSQGYASTRGLRRLRVIHFTCHAFDSASAFRHALDRGPRLMPRTAPIAFVIDDDLEVRSSIQGTPAWPTNNQRETGNNHHCANISRGALL